jgi:hypothetical protein
LRKGKPCMRKEYTWNGRRQTSYCGSEEVA